MEGSEAGKKHAFRRRKKLKQTGEKREPFRGGEEWMGRGGVGMKSRFFPCVVVLLLLLFKTSCSP